jgi:hypothetical protein
MPLLSQKTQSVEIDLLGSAHLGYLPLPRSLGQVYLTLASDPAAIGDLHKARCVPPVFPRTLVGPLTDAVEKVAIVHECSPTLTESPGLGTAGEGYRGEDCPKPRRWPFPSHLPVDVTCWPRTVDERGELERKFPYLFTLRWHAVFSFVGI